MDPSYIIAFVHSAQDFANKVLDLPVKIGKPRLYDGRSSNNDISAIVGLSGDVSGFIAISLSARTAAQMVGQFVGVTISPGDPDFADGVGEIANIIAGGAKSQFAADRSISITCPSVVIGPNHKVIQQQDMPVIEIPIETDFGEFFIVLAIRENVPATKRVADRDINRANV